MTIMATRPGAGWYEDQEQKDNDLGPMPDETEFRQLVQHLIDDGDDRAWKAGRRARRTLVEMAPGFVRQPVLRMTTATIVFAASACGACNGEGGRTVDTSSDGVIRQHWVSCQTCRGLGVAR
ncbi:hypothetical protein ACUN29_41620 (plasmid) [Streptomyces sp. WC2508]|uniref:hypothetical protein n=1 Tax=Streptomyces sp. WC2508 TaxID=3461405 RepID=UPI0040449DD4